MKSKLLLILAIGIVPTVLNALTVEESKKQLVATKKCGSIKNKCDLSGANLSGLSLPESDIRDAVLPGVNMSDSDFSGFNFSCFSSTFQNYVCPAPEKGSVMTGANMAGGLFPYSNFRNVDLENAIISTADLTSANLESAILRKANLRGSLLSDVNAEQINLVGADLSGASFEGSSEEERTNLERANLTGAIVDQYTNFKNTSLYQANIMGVDMRKPKLCNTKMPDGTINNSGCD